MQLLSVRNLSFSWGYKPLFTNLSFSLNRGQVLGVAGPNGAGKSSLIALLTGQAAPDSGDIAIASGSRLALVSQQADFGAAITVGDYLLSETIERQDRLATLEAELADCRDPERLTRLLAEYGQAQDQALALGTFQARDLAGHLLQRTGLSISLESELTNLSGGEASILSILKALVGNPDILILDEPGNHLDYIGLAWLERLLGELDKATILVSHNRYLLDQAADGILYLEAGRHSLHQGSYSQFRARRAQALAEEAKAWAMRERELHALNIALKDLLHRASQSYNPPPKVMIDLANTKKKIAALRLIHDQGKTPVAPAIKLKLQGDEYRGQTALTVSGLSLSYGPRLVLDNLHFQIQRGQRVALVGANGCGKTSLIRQICDQAQNPTGPVRLAPSIKMGLISQQSPFTAVERSLIDEVRDWGALSADRAFALIAPFGFAWNELDKPIGTLSGGELQRLQLARLSYAKVNFLILDEPSNHLDIPSRESLEECLENFEGTMLIVSHDRYLLDRLAQRILHLERGKLTEFEGNFSDWLARQPEVRTPDGVNQAKGPKPATDAKPIQPTPESRIALLESEIAMSMSKIDGLRQSDPALAARLQAGLTKKQSELDRLYEDWVG